MHYYFQGDGRSLRPLPSDIANKNYATNLIKTPILLAEFVGRVRESSRFLGLGATYKSHVCFRGYLVTSLVKNRF